MYKCKAAYYKVTMSNAILGWNGNQGYALLSVGQVWSFQWCYVSITLLTERAIHFWDFFKNCLFHVKIVMFRHFNDVSWVISCWSLCGSFSGVVKAYKGHLLARVCGDVTEAKKWLKGVCYMFWFYCMVRTECECVEVVICLFHIHVCD